MAETSTPPPAHDSKPQLPQPPNPNSQPPNPDSQSNSAPHQQSSSTTHPPLIANPNSVPTLFPPLHPSPVNPYAQQAPIGSSGATVFPPPAMPSFRPAGAPAPISAPQFNLAGYQPPQGPGVPPPGVSSAPPQMVHGGMYQVPPPGQPPNPLLRPPYMAMPNGYLPPGVPQGAIPPPGVLRYPYPSIGRPAFPLRPPGTVGVVPLISRPPMLGVRPPIITSIVRPPILPVFAPVEKPQTTVYVGKISSTVENDFMLSLLQFCGPVKSWKRPQDPSNGTPKAFGFCEFESAEGVLRSLRLLSKLNIDGQELVLNVNQATKDYLERYVEKKRENSKQKEMEEKETKEEDIAKSEKGDGDENNEQPRPSDEESQDKIESGSKGNDMSTFGLVSDEDREADREATEKITSTIEERFKSRPLPPPPPPPQKFDVTTTSNSEGPSKSGEKDSDVDVKKDDKNDDEMTSETKTAAGTESPDRGRRYDSRGRERDRDRDLKREKERELERIEWERERERARRERDREAGIQKAERAYKERVKEWETKEKEREYQRKYEKEREKEKERERRRLVQDQEDESDDDSRRRRRRSDVEGKRRKRQREREEDFADRLKEEEEIAEAKKKAEEEEEEEQKQKLEREALQLSSAPVANGKEKVMSPETDSSEIEEKGPEQIFDNYSGVTNDNGGGVLENGSNDESIMTLGSESDLRLSGNAPAKKLGFGLSGLGKRTAVLSVFNEEDDDDSHKDKKMRPLVPIDYSAEELQATLPNAPGTTPPNMASAADVAKRPTMGSKDERLETERDRSRRGHDKSSYRDRDQKDHETSRAREENREKSLGREHGDKSKSSENNNVVDAKQLIDMIPKTKEELFAYDINWAVYDKHGLHERIRPWIVKKITEFLGEEEATLVDYIVSSIQDHVKASQMLDQLQSILDEEAEMFVLKMWRMLIFEIKRVEAGLLSKPKA